MPSKADIETFLHDQCVAWNARDRERFFALHDWIAPGRITLEYVGLARHDDGRASLATSWDKHQPQLLIEEIDAAVTGNEAIAYNCNRFPDHAVRTFEHYRFDGGDMHVRYFLIPEEKPQGG